MVMDLFFNQLCEFYQEIKLFVNFSQWFEFLVTFIIVHCQLLDVLDMNSYMNVSYSLSLLSQCVKEHIENRWFITPYSSYCYNGTFIACILY